MSADAIVHGLLLGLVFGVLGCGVVLVHRVSGVVNFAHGETGALAAAIMAKLVLDEHWPFVVALAAVLAIGAAIGALTEVFVARRLRNRPRLVLLVATIGLAQLLLVVHLALPAIREVAPFPSPLHRHLTIGSVRLAGPDFFALAVIPAVVVALWLWLARTPAGLATRAVGDNPDGAELLGIRRTRVACTAWAIAGALAALTAVLANPIQGVVIGRPTEALGVGLLLRGLAAGLVGRMRSLPLALVGGLVVGLIQAFATSGHVDPAIADFALLVFVLGVVLLPGAGERTGRFDSELARVGPARPIRAWVYVAAAAAVLAPPVVARSSQLFSLSRVALYAVVAVSLVILTGWLGQLSLGQFALVGVGTFTASVLETHGVPFWLTLPAAAVVGAGVSFAVGLPALRVRGTELAVTTLALAVACSGWLFTRSALLDSTGVATVRRASVVRGPVAYYELCIGALLGAVVLARVVRRAPFGRRLLAVRSDERRASALGIPPVAVKLAAFALAGAIAALAGALLGGLRIHSAPGDFGPSESLRIVAITVIGGAGSVGGAVAGAVVVLGVPAIFGSTTIAGLLPSGLGLLGLALIFPDGLVGLLRPGRRAAARPAVDLGGLTQEGGTLAVRDVTVRFGGRIALDSVSFELAAGEVVALVGPNGAGKSTLLDVISGFIVPSAGTVLLAGEDVTHMPASVRAHLGLARTVQDGRLFEDLSVRELLALAGSSAPPDDDTPCQELAVGERRLLEVAAAVATRPRVLLLDEPTAGLTADEAEGMLAVIRQGSTTVVMVEHDLDLVARIAGRVITLESGRVTADGPPSTVLGRRRRRVTGAASD